MHVDLWYILRNRKSGFTPYSIETPFLERVQQMQDDALWVQQTLAGDRQAFGFLVRKYWRPIYAQILSVIHNHADAEELTNDAFIEAYLDLLSLKRPSSFPTGCVRSPDIAAWTGCASAKKHLSHWRIYLMK